MNRLLLGAWLAVVGLVDRLREWPSITLAAWNIGKADQLPRLFADAIALNEAGDQWDAGEIIAQAQAAGFRIITGAKPGQSSTPLAWHPEALELVKVRRFLLAERQYVGPGKGPRMLKTKWLIGGLFRHRATGRLIWIFAVHYVATQGKRRRRRVAIHMSSRIRLFGARVRRPVMVLGDYNALPDSPTLRPLRKAGWRVNHRLGRLLRTHGRRAIDHVWWEPRHWLRFVRHFTVRTESDHDAIVVEFQLKPRKNRKRKR